MSNKIGNEFANLLKELNSTIRSAKEFTGKNVAPTVKDILENAARREYYGAIESLVMHLISLPTLLVIGRWLTYSAPESPKPSDFGWILGMAIFTCAAIELLVGISGMFGRFLNIKQIKENPKSWLLEYVREMMMDDSDFEE